MNYSTRLNYFWINFSFLSFVLWVSVFNNSLPQSVDGRLSIIINRPIDKTFTVYNQSVLIYSVQAACTPKHCCLQYLKSLHQPWDKYDTEVLS